MQMTMSTEYDYKIKSSFYTAINQLSESGYCVSPDEKTEDVYKTMQLNPAITEFTVVDDGVAVGFMTRTILNEKLGGRYGFEVHARNPIGEIMYTDFLKVDGAMAVDLVSKLAMDRPFERMYNPIVIEQEGKYAGIVTVRDLLDFSTKVALAERDEIAIMKDSLKIGLFFMDRDYIIQDHYSRYLEEIIADTDLCGKCFPELLSASVSAKELGYIKDYFEMLFEQSYDQDTLDDINPLNELYYVHGVTGDQKVFQCGFTTIERSQGERYILVTIYDITAKTELQRRLQEEENKRQEEMKSVFELLQVDPRVFGDFLEDAEYEFERINETFENDSLSAHAVLVEIYQSIHAIKSNAVILGLDTFGAKAHNLEDGIKQLCALEEVTFDLMQKLAMDIEKLVEEKEGFKITIQRIHSFKPAGDGKETSQHHVLVESLSKTVQKVSEDMGKKIRFMTDDIDTEAIARGPRRIIKEVLMQLIRNSVAHGIESPEDRIIDGKPEIGCIQLSIKLTEGNIHIKLKDDGRGIDYDKIAQKALRLNIIKKEDAHNRDILLKTIFSPGFSTAENEGLHAGRGIGLNLVQDRVRSEKGCIKIQSEAGKGTVFTIIFPLTV
jgi:two-component system chemotaxis sensor kinase CheA